MARDNADSRSVQTTEYRHFTRASLAVCGAAAVLAFAMVRLAGLDFSPAGVVTIGPALLLLVGLGYVYGSLRPIPFVASTCRSIAVLLVSSILAYTISAASLARGTPLVDPHLAAIDASLGFSARAMTEAVASIPLAPEVLGLIYVASSVLVVPLIVVFAWLGRHDRAAELGFLFAGCVILCCTIGIATPAIGSFETLGISADAVKRLPSNAGVYYIQDFRAWHDGVRHTIDWSDPMGLITFPSFHTCMALVPAWAARGIARLFWPLVLFAVPTLVSIIPMGAHYATDIAGGTIVTIVVIAAACGISARALSAACGTRWRARRARPSPGGSPPA